MDDDPGTAYGIDEPRLLRFVADQVRLIVATPLPAGLAEELRRGADGVELDAVWLGAGLATQIGLRLLEHPEVFVRTRGQEA